MGWCTKPANIKSKPTEIPECEYKVMNLRPNDKDGFCYKCFDGYDIKVNIANLKDKGSCVKKHTN